MKTEAIIFDMDGVLFDSGYGHELAFNAVLETFNITDFKYQDYKGISTESVFRMIFTKNDIQVTDLQLISLVERKRSISDKLNCEYRPMPNAISILKSIAKQNIKLGLVTSGSMNSMNGFLMSNDITNLFDTLICIENVSRSKPDPEPYIRAISNLSVVASSVLVVEDSDAGVKSALAAGAKVIKYDPSFLNQTKNFAVIRSLTELNSILDFKYENI